MAQPTRNDGKSLKYVGYSTYVYNGNFIIRRWKPGTLWDVSNFANEHVADGKTLKEAVKNLERVLDNARTHNGTGVFAY